MREFHIFDIKGKEIIAFAEEMLYVDNEVIILKINGEVSSVINKPNIVAVIEISKQYHKKLIKRT